MQANKFYEVKDNIFVSRHEEILQNTIVYCRYIDKDNFAYIYNKDKTKLLIILYNNNLHEVLKEL